MVPPVGMRVFYQVAFWSQHGGIPEGMQEDGFAEVMLAIHQWHLMPRVSLLHVNISCRKKKKKNSIIHGNIKHAQLGVLLLLNNTVMTER